MKLSVICSLTFSVIASAPAHSDGSYYRNADDGFKDRSRWMKDVPGNRKLSEMAIPGTHDSSANGKPGNVVLDIVYTQCMNFDQQLRSGISFFDIRVRHFRNSFPLHHGSFFLDKYFINFLNSVQSFVVKNPSETVLFRLKHEYTEAENTRSKLATLDYYLKSYSTYLKTSRRRITLDAAKGKFIIFSDNDEFNDRGILYDSSNIQDAYKLGTIWDLYSKWESVKSQLNKSKESLTSDGSQIRFAKKTTVFHRK
jgi:1-phosphatidylinositol phosphodiesterase